MGFIWRLVSNWVWVHIGYELWNHLAVLGPCEGGLIVAVIQAFGRKICLILIRIGAARPGIGQLGDSRLS